MKKIFLLFTLAFFFISCGESSKTNDDEQSSDNDNVATDSDDETNDDDTYPESYFETFVNTLQADLNKSDALGVSAAIMKGGKIIFARAYGFKDAEGKVSLTPETLMQIGSTTKQMTTTALLQKVEEGKAELENSLAEIIPDLEFKLDETWNEQIKLHHLISHQGAFYDYTPWDEMPSDDMLEAVTYGTFAKSYFLMAPPGSFYNYSNPNFSMTGFVTEKLDTRFWPDIMVEDVYRPLGMDRTYLRKTEVIKDGDYSDSFGLDFNDAQSGKQVSLTIDQIADSAFTRPAGLAWTTPTQMMTWADFIMNGNEDVLSDKYRKMITTPQVDTLYADGTMHYGYGMFVETGYMDKNGNWYEIPVWEHGGATISFSNTLYILPEQDFAIAICSSGYGTDFTKSLDVALTTMAELPEPSDNAPAYEIDPEKFDDHVGTYNDQYNVGIMEVTREGNKLMVNAPTIEEYGYEVGPELVAVSSDIFLIYLNGEPLDITFVKKDGKSTFMRNRVFVATRTEEEETLKVPTREQVKNFIKRSKITPDNHLNKLLKFKK